MIWIIKDLNGQKILEAKELTKELVEFIIKNDYRLYKVINGEEFPDELNYCFVLHQHGISSTDLINWIFSKYGESEQIDTVEALYKFLESFPIEEKIRICAMLLGILVWDLLILKIKEEKFLEIIKEIKKYKNR